MSNITMYIPEQLREIAFNTTVKCDMIKDEYVKTKNIKLLRIPFTEQDNIEIILAKNLQ